MFFLLVLFSLSMMKCCVLSGSSIKLLIVLSAPEFQLLRLGHAATEKRSEGSPLLLCRVLYGGFLSQFTEAAGMHQQLKTDQRGSTPSPSSACFSSPPTSQLEATHVCLPPLDATLPIISLHFFSFFPLCPCLIPTSLLNWPNKQAESGLCSHYF